MVQDFEAWRLWTRPPKFASPQPSRPGKIMKHQQSILARHLFLGSQDINWETGATKTPPAISESLAWKKWLRSALIDSGVSISWDCVCNSGCKPCLPLWMLLDDSLFDLMHPNSDQPAVISVSRSIDHWCSSWWMCSNPAIFWCFATFTNKCI